MSYRFFEDIVIADVAFEAEGKTLPKMFESAGLAVTATMVEDVKTVRQMKTKEIELKNKDIEHLLHDFLQEIIFEKDAHLLLFSGYKIKIQQTKIQKADSGKLEAGSYILTAACKGEKLNMQKHELLVDVKAVSWHMFEVEHDNKTKKWRSFVILDV